MPCSGRCQPLLYSISQGRIPTETYLIQVDDVPGNETDHFHFGQDTTVAQGCTLLCQRPLEFVDNIPSLIVLNKANYCIEQEQAGNDSQIDPVLQACSQYKRQLQKSCQPETGSS